MIIEYTGEKIDYFKALYEEARNALGEESALMTRRMEQYLGSPEIDGSPVPATAVRNITYELIESQVSGYIPTPVVSPKSVSERSTRNARAIETLCRRVRNDLDFTMPFFVFFKSKLFFVHKILLFFLNKQPYYTPLTF